MQHHQFHHNHLQHRRHHNYHHHNRPQGELTKLLQSSLECVAGARGPPSIDKGADLGRSITYKQYYLQILKNPNSYNIFIKYSEYF